MGTTYLQYVIEKALLDYAQNKPLTSSFPILATPDQQVEISPFVTFYNPFQLRRVNLRRAIVPLESDYKIEKRFDICLRSG